MPVPEVILSNWNDGVTLLTFGLTLWLGYHQLQYYRKQPASLDIAGVTDAEYHDFDRYTRYNLTVKLRNNGRDPVSIPDAGLEINSESLDANTHEVDGRANLPAHEFRHLRLDSNEYRSVELHAIGDTINTTSSVEGLFWMDSSDGRVETNITFDRAP